MKDPYCSQYGTVRPCQVRDNERLTWARNRGDLAEGWYDPTTLQKAQTSAASNNDLNEPPKRRASPDCGSHRRDESSEEDTVGPTLPGSEGTQRKAGKKPGPAIPSSLDLELQKGILHKSPFKHVI